MAKAPVDDDAAGHGAVAERVEEIPHRGVVALQAHLEILLLTGGMSEYDSHLRRAKGTGAGGARGGPRGLHAPYPGSLPRALARPDTAVMSKFLVDSRTLLAVRDPLGRLHDQLLGVHTVVDGYQGVLGVQELEAEIYT